MTRRPSTRRRPVDRDPVVRCLRGPEPGDRGELVDALAELLVARVERRQARAAADVTGDGQDQDGDQDHVGRIFGESMEGDTA